MYVCLRFFFVFRIRTRFTAPRFAVHLCCIAVRLVCRRGWLHTPHTRYTTVWFGSRYHALHMDCSTHGWFAHRYRTLRLRAYALPLPRWITRVTPHRHPRTTHTALRFWLLRITGLPPRIATCYLVRFTLLRFAVYTVAAFTFWLPFWIGLRSGSHLRTPVLVGSGSRFAVYAAVTAWVGYTRLDSTFMQFCHHTTHLHMVTSVYTRLRGSTVHYTFVYTHLHARSHHLPGLFRFATLYLYLHTVLYRLHTHHRLRYTRLRSHLTAYSSYAFCGSCLPATVCRAPGWFRITFGYILPTTTCRLPLPAGRAVYTTVPRSPGLVALPPRSPTFHCARFTHTHFYLWFCPFTYRFPVTFVTVLTRFTGCWFTRTTRLLPHLRHTLLLQFVAFATAPSTGCCLVRAVTRYWFIRVLVGFRAPSYVYCRFLVTLPRTRRAHGIRTCVYRCWFTFTVPGYVAFPTRFCWFGSRFIYYTVPHSSFFALVLLIYCRLPAHYTLRFTLPTPYGWFWLLLGYLPRGYRSCRRLRYFGSRLRLRLVLSITRSTVTTVVRAFWTTRYVLVLRLTRLRFTRSYAQFTRVAGYGYCSCTLFGLRYAWLRVTHTFRLVLRLGLRGCPLPATPHLPFPCSYAACSSHR